MNPFGLKRLVKRIEKASIILALCNVMRVQLGLELSVRVGIGRLRKLLHCHLVVLPSRGKSARDRIAQKYDNAQVEMRLKPLADLGKVLGQQR